MCPNIWEDKLNHLKEYFEYYDLSVFSNKKIEYNKKKLNKYIVTCNAREYLKVLNYVSNYENHHKICPNCKKEFISPQNTCTHTCGRATASIQLKKYWEKEKGNGKVSDRNKKISNWRKENKDIISGNDAWNKSLKGREYLKHYDKPDGTNSLIDGLKKNTKFFKKTTIEIKFDDLLKNMGLNYQYSWFCSNRQFDFLISFEEFVLVVELDGDYWHKSKRVFSDPDLRKITRLEDYLKEQVIKKIKNTSKEWYLVRFWEYDINHNFDKIEEYIKTFKEGVNVKELVNKIKKWYNEQS